MKICIQKQEIQKTLQGTQYKVALQKINKGIKFQEQQDDNNFPANLSSIGNDIRSDLNITWKHIQQFCDDPNYSQNIQDIKVSEYCNKSITKCLLIMNWFAKSKFMIIFSDRFASKLIYYQYVVMVQGIIYKIFVNSKIAMKDGKILFAEFIVNSIFPAIFQKAVAKVYGNYQSISDSLVELLQIWTGYALQQFSIQRYTSSQLVQFLNSALINKSLPFFRTRNSIRLQVAGLISNTAYNIVRLFQMDNLILIQFLQLNNQNWKGKHSKTSQFWKNKQKQIIQHEVTFQGIVNYIEIHDLIGISKQLIILQNTQKFNTNWIRSTKPKTKHIFSLSLSFISAFSQNSYNITTKSSYDTLISLHFMKKMCRNSIYIICEQTCEFISCSFKENSDGNFIATILQIGKKYLLYVYVEDIEGKGMNANVTVNIDQVWCQIKQVQGSIFVQERSLLQFMRDIPSITTVLDSSCEKSLVKIKNLYNQLGLGLISVILQPNFYKKVTIYFDKDKLKQVGIQILNCEQKHITYISPCHSILIFKFKYKFKYRQGDPFPPKELIRVVISQIL